MKSANIIIIGNEILSGRTIDTNFPFITNWLSDLGIEVTKKITVRDKIEDIVIALEESKNADIVITTGGLGPTDDDLTREALAAFLKKRLIFDESEWNKILNIFKKRWNNNIADSNKRQAFIVEGASFLQNDMGTASGIYYKDESGTLYILLPGPPNENQFIINNNLKEKIVSSNSYKAVKKESFRIYEVGESSISDLLKDVWSDGMGIYALKEGYIRVEIREIDDNEELFREQVSKVEELLKESEMFYTDDIDLSVKVFTLLNSKELTVSFAESITGGSLSGEFISKNSGSCGGTACKVLMGSIIAYSDFAKTEILGVKKETIEKYGVVSKEVTIDMANGIKEVFPDTDISVAVTGYTGGKQMGLIHFGFIFGKEQLYHEKQFFSFNRDLIVQRAINHIYITIYQYYSESTR